MISIIPAILTNNPDELKEMLHRCEGVVDRVQIDIIDGVFADNKTIDPAILENIETSVKIDFHLMTKNPADWVERCIRGMADRIIGQVEMMDNQIQFIEKVQEGGCEVGLALDLDTSIAMIDKTILKDVDAILVMSVSAGFGGQKFNPNVITKIEDLDHIRAFDDTPFSIIDDGGISLENFKDLRIEGVNEVAIGRKLFEGDLKENIEKYLKTPRT
jgi:ribulose-phosphate 3-epimerase